MLYLVAAETIARVRLKKCTVKSVVLGGNYKRKKLLYALVCETLKYYNIIEKILATTSLCKKESSLRKPELAHVLLYDFLFGKGITGAPKLKNVVERHKTVLRAELARLKIKLGVSSDLGLINSNSKLNTPIPRYVRINTLRITVEDAVAHFEKNMGKFLINEKQPNDYESYISVISSLKQSCFLKDFHMDDLLVFHSKTEFHKNALYKKGCVILQDKASCVPASLLRPKPGSNVIDCCAAPGNKTSHLAALMKGIGKIFAFERDGERAATLETQLSKAAVLCAEVINQDFLTTDPLDAKYSKVKYVLVDPSCSGSGIVDRMEYTADGRTQKKEERIKRLSNFQAKILKHALSFPAVKNVVYSTCSVYTEENEQVVEDVLEQVKDVFKLVNINRKYTTRGFGVTEVGNYCLRFQPETDLTNGFFVALFERISDKCDRILIATRDSISTTSKDEKFHIDCTAGRNAESTRTANTSGEKKKLEKKKKKKKKNKTRKLAAVFSD